MKHWYVPLLVGILFLVVSIVAFTSPLRSLLTLSLLFAFSFVGSGIAEVFFSIANRDQLESWGWSLVFGLITLAAGVLLLLNPALSVTTLSLFIGFTVLFRSVSAISFALDIRRYGSREWGGVLAFGIFGILASFALLWNPVVAGLSVVVLIGFNFLFAGLFSLFLSFQLRKLHKYADQLSPVLEERLRALQEDIRRERST